MNVESNKLQSSSLSDTPPSNRPCSEKPHSKITAALQGLERTVHFKTYSENPCSKMDNAIAAMQEQYSLEFRSALERTRHVQAYNKKHEANERYFSLVDSWKHPISSDVQSFFGVLKVAPHIDYIEITSVSGSRSEWKEKLDHLLDHCDFDWRIDYKAKLKRTLKTVYLDATYSCYETDLL